VSLLVVTTADAWDVSHPRYRAGDSTNRRALVAAYVRAGTCALCWSSLRGPVAAEELGPNGLDSVALDASPGSRNRWTFRLTASGPDGPVFGVVRFDFGDGRVSAPKAMAGALEVTHDYVAGGEYAVKAWLERPGQARHLVTSRVTVKP